MSGSCPNMSRKKTLFFQRFAIRTSKNTEFFRKKRFSSVFTLRTSKPAKSRQGESSLGPLFCDGSPKTTFSGTSSNCRAVRGGGGRAISHYTLTFLLVFVFSRTHTHRIRLVVPWSVLRVAVDRHRRVSSARLLQLAFNGCLPVRWRAESWTKWLSRIVCFVSGPLQVRVQKTHVACCGCLAHRLASYSV